MVETQVVAAAVALAVELVEAPGQVRVPGRSEARQPGTGKARTGGD